MHVSLNIMRWLNIIFVIYIYTTHPAGEKNSKKINLITSNFIRSWDEERQ